jgi:hypothetical protein
MLDFNTIINDKELESYFLDYAKYAYLLHCMPPIDSNCNLEETIGQFVIIEGSEITVNKLKEELNKRYGLLVIDENDCEDFTNQIIISCTRYYAEKLSIDCILSRNTEHISKIAMEKCFKILN